MTSYEVLGSHAVPVLIRKNFQITAELGPTYVEDRQGQQQ